MRQNNAAAMERALHWDTTNPQIPDSFGTLIHMYADGGDPTRIVSLYERATRLSPLNASFWADLAAAYDWAGRPTEALAAFRKAQRLFPNSADINWRLANFYARQGRGSDVLESLQRVMVSGGVAHNEIFKLASASTNDSRAILNAIPIPGSALVEYLDFCVRNKDIKTAEQVWEYMLKMNASFSLRDSFVFFDALIHQRQIAELQNAWALLALRFPSEVTTKGSDGNLVLNGSFEHEIADGGLDWRILPAQGAEVSVDHEHASEGARALRIDFDSTQNFYYCHVFQYVPVRPSTRYRFSGNLRAYAISTESGPGFEIFDAYDMKKLFISGKGLTGTSDWTRQDLPFTTPPETSLLIVRVARRPSQKIANQIGGTVWIDDVRLQAID